VSFLGEVYIDGIKKTIKLPEIENKQSVLFTCDRLHKKWRINVEVGSKGVTYEWNVDSEKLYFAALIKNADTQLLVE